MYHPSNTFPYLEFQKYFLKDQIKASQVSSLTPQIRTKVKHAQCSPGQGIPAKVFPGGRCPYASQPIGVSLGEHHQFTSVSGTRIAKKESEVSGD